MTTERKVNQRQPGQAELTGDRPLFVPATDIYEKEDSILICCDMPGVDDKSLEITLEDNVLTLTGTQADVQPKEHDLVVGEYHTGVYHRSFTISQEIDHSKIKARIQNGVLKLQLPKAEQAQPKRIPVEVGK